MLEPVARDPLNLETLHLFRRVMGHRSRLDDPRAVERFLKKASRALAANSTNATRLQGIRTQALFAQLVVAMDGCELMLTVDAGDIYADGFVSPGDFLLVLRDGRRLLVEVKTVGRCFNSKGDLDVMNSQRASVRAKEVEGLRRAASLMGAEPFYAAYFEFLHLWALVSLGDLTKVSSNYTFQFTHDMTRNHMSVLGDRTIGVEPPIEIRLHPYPGKEPECSDADENVQVPFVVAKRTIHVGGRQVTDPDDAEFATFLGIYGHWESAFAPNVEAGRTLYVSIRSEPEEPVEGQRFQIAGPLSHMYSKYFMQRTSDEEGAPAALDIEATPSMIATYLQTHPRDRQFKTWQLEVRAADAEVDSRPDAEDWS